MTKFFSGLLALFLLGTSFSAQAGWNLRQNDDGTTDWVREDSASTTDTRTVGAVYLTVHLADISTASTTAVVVPVTDGKISYIQTGVANATTAAAAYLDFYVGTSAGVVTTEITNGVTRATIAPGDATEAFTPTSVNTVEKNDIIYIHSDGGSTTASVATFTITVIPR